MARRSVRVADYIMRRIAEAGVRHAFLVPGGGAMYLDDALAQSGLDWIPCHHEQACGIAAEAYGRIAENLGVAIVTTGPGSTNVLTPVAGAWIESAPLLIVSGQVKRSDMLRNAPLRQKGPQEVNVVRMVEPITKYAVTVDDPSSIRYHLDKALHLARSGRPGPVWIDVPLDVQAAHIDPEQLTGWSPTETSALAPDAAALDRLVGMINSAERPLLLAGHGVRLSGGAVLFRGLYERLQIPVVTTWNALDLIPYDHPLCVGRPGVVALRAPNFAVQNCDLLIAIGSRLDNIVTAFNARNFARGARKAIVDVDPNELSKLDMTIDLPIVSDARTFLLELLRRANDIQQLGRSEWLSRCAHWKLRYSVKSGRQYPKQGSISHYQFVDALSDAIPADTLVATGSSGLGVEVFYTVFRNKPGQRIFLTSGLGAMGYGLPAAIGASLANGDKPMVAVESDGSLQLNVQELATLKALNLPICLFIMNNNGYASIRNTQRNYFEGRYIGTGPESSLFIPDTTRIADSLGIPAMRIKSVEELVPGLKQALESPRPFICDVCLLENEALAPKVSAMPQPDGSIVSMPLEDMAPLLPLAELEENMTVPLSAASRTARS
jgi:acetolactate synthase-1/2/3 large subunit